MHKDDVTFHIVQILPTDSDFLNQNSGLGQQLYEKINVSSFSLQVLYRHLLLKNEQTIISNKSNQA
jgi:hypothetical protein